MKRLYTFGIFAALLLWPFAARADFGAEIMKQSNGLVVKKMSPTGLAAQLGLKPDDVIHKCNGQVVATEAELWKVIEGQRYVAIDYTRASDRTEQTLRCLVEWPKPNMMYKEQANPKNITPDKDVRGPIVIKKLEGK